jgi:flagellar biosynthetic protein FliQ
MTGAEVLDLGRDAIWTTVLVAAGPMIVGLVVGLVVSLLQTLTQIQEQTLVFVPKILAIFLAILLFLPIMGGLLGSFTNGIFERIASGGGG